MIAAMWSGGKDSCLAVWRFVKSGGKVDRLICMLNESGTSRAHRLSREALSRQAEAVGIEAVFGSSTWGGYREVLRGIVKELGARRVIFGDIFLEEHRNWIEEFCSKIGVKPVFPLWGDDTLSLAEEFVSEGFEAYVVAIRKDIDVPILGKKFDEKLIETLLDAGVDPCGENGEFHTFVADGPLFRNRVEFRFGRVWKNEKYFVLEVHLTEDQNDLN